MSGSYLNFMCFVTPNCNEHIHFCVLIVLILFQTQRSLRNAYQLLNSHSGLGDVETKQDANVANTLQTANKIEKLTYSANTKVVDPEMQLEKIKKEQNEVSYRYVVVFVCCVSNLCDA